MRKEKNIRSFSDWLFSGKNLAIVVIVAVLLIAVTTVIVYKATTDKEQKVTAYLTVEGLGEDLDFKNRVIKIVDGDSVKQIFRYEDYSQKFGKLLFHKNELSMFMGVRAENSKAFHVQIDGMDDNNLDQAFVYEGQTITIKYY